MRPPEANQKPRVFAKGLGFRAKGFCISLGVFYIFFPGARILLGVFYFFTTQFYFLQGVFNIFLAEDVKNTL